MFATDPNFGCLLFRALKAHEVGDIDQTQVASLLAVNIEKRSRHVQNGEGRVAKGMSGYA